MAASQLEDNVVLGTMMLSLGEVDGLVSGAVHSTANTIRPALQIIKTKPNAKAVSSIFFMCSAGTGLGLWRLRRDSRSGCRNLGRYRDPERGLGGRIWDPAQGRDDQLFNG